MYDEREKVGQPTIFLVYSRVPHHHMLSPPRPICALAQLHISMVEQILGGETGM